MCVRAHARRVHGCVCVALASFAIYGSTKVNTTDHHSGLLLTEWFEGKFSNGIVSVQGPLGFKESSPKIRFGAEMLAKPV